MYAKDTTVTPEKTLAEIQTTLRRYGATAFGFVDQGERVAIAFEMRERRLRFALRLPSLEEMKKTPTGKTRATKEALAAREAAIRQRWRALLLVLKAKMESVESGIETFEEAFLANVLLPDGTTMAEWAAPQVKQAYLSGQMPPLLLGDGRR